jgi:Cu/Ag efflux protein CusF
MRGLFALSTIAVAAALIACGPSATVQPAATQATGQASQAPAATQLVGMLREVNGNTLTIENASGPVAATLASNVTMVKQTSASLQELKVGEQVTFSGQRDSNGDMIASFVRAVPPGFEEMMMPQFTVGPMEAPAGGEGRQISPELRQQIAQRAQGGQVPEEVLQRLQAQQAQRPAAIARSANELIITGPIESATDSAIVVTSGSVTYTVRLGESAPVLRVVPASVSDLQPGSRIQGRGDQVDGRWTLTFVMVLGDTLGFQRSP